MIKPNAEGGSLRAGMQSQQPRSQDDDDGWGVVVVLVVDECEGACLRVVVNEGRIPLTEFFLQKTFTHHSRNRSIETQECFLPYKLIRYYRRNIQVILLQSIRYLP